MDVKGAYLNSYLSEKVYMKQPDGYDDGTRHVCQLIKTLYSLKQAGHEWNHVLDKHLKEIGFKPLYSDPCVYVRRSRGDNSDSLEIITIWVDDLLLFMSLDRLMTNLKSKLNSMFKLMDMGEPSKIVGIEITQSEN